MSSRRRSSMDVFEGQPSPASSDDRSLERRVSVRLGRSSNAATPRPRVSIGRVTTKRVATGAREPSRQTSARTRRPTPVVRRRRTGQTDETETNDPSPLNSPQPARRSATVRYSDGNNDTQYELRRSTASSSRLPIKLSWYERLMPECILNMSSPITGYERSLDSDVDDEEYEILERQRLKRNRRVRRRLLTLMLVATAASVFFYTRGKMFRKVGVKAAVSSMKHRLEDGLTKSIQETMGK